MEINNRPSLSIYYQFKSLNVSTHGAKIVLDAAVLLSKYKRIEISFNFNIFLNEGCETKLEMEIRWHAARLESVLTRSEIPDVIRKECGNCFEYIRTCASFNYCLSALRMKNLL